MHSQHDKPITNCFTVDVEDWFHLLDISGAPAFNKWGSMEARVENNTYRILELLEKHKVKATFFVLGWVAERHKSMVRKIYDLGHEVASHGYGHILYYSSSEDDVLIDLTKSKTIIEDIIGGQVFGFRAPGFSAKKENMWIFNKIKQAGYIYDSSVFPAVRTHGGNMFMPIEPFEFDTGLVELPIGVAPLFFLRAPFGGGGYFRLYPLSLFKYLSGLYAQKTKKPFVFYIHPREIDPDQPRIKMQFRRKFQTYFNLKNTYSKVDKMLHMVKFGKLLKDLMLDVY